MDKALSVSDVSKILFDFYNDYINLLPYYHFTKTSEDLQILHIIIDIRKNTSTNIEDYTKALSFKTIEEAFASHYRLIPPFYNYSSCDRSNPNSWKSHLLVPSSVFLEIIWTNMLYKFFKNGLINYTEPLDSKIAIYSFITRNIDDFSIEKDKKICKQDALIILQNVQVLLNSVFKNYKNPTEIKLEFELKRFQKLQETYKSLNKKFKNLTKNNTIAEKTFEDVKSIKEFLEVYEKNSQNIEKISNDMNAIADFENENDRKINNIINDLKTIQYILERLSNKIEYISTCMGYSDDLK